MPMRLKGLVIRYVPQMLLRRFRGGGKLYELDKQTGEVKETTPGDGVHPGADPLCNRLKVEIDYRPAEGYPGRRLERARS